MNYNEAIDIIENTGRFGKKPGVYVIKEALERLSYEEKSIRYIHVAGTNGKGSTCAFLDGIFRAQGYKTGLFTSPHLIDFEERIRINGIMIPKDRVAYYTSYIHEKLSDIGLTFFDYCVLIAIMYFRDEKIDIAIIETGLGGRYDSTNALGIPLASVITPIGFDHMTILGDTIDRIAYEKAGIIKKNVPVFCARQDKKAERVIMKTAEEADSSVTFVDEATIDSMSSIGMNMLGLHQHENAALAFLTAEYVLKEILEEQLKREHVDNSCQTVITTISDTVSVNHNRDILKYNKDVAIDAIKSTVWSGRMEVVSQKPFLCIDGAHNSHGIRALSDSLKQLWPDEKFRFIMGVMADKDYLEMIMQLVPLAHDFYTVTVDNARSLSAIKLAEDIETLGVRATALSSIIEIKGILSEDYRNIALGSLYYIGELKACINIILENE